MKILLKCDTQEFPQLLTDLHTRSFAQLSEVYTSSKRGFQKGPANFNTFFIVSS